MSHRFISGIDDESIAYAAESLKMLRAEVMHRAARLKKLPREVCPDKKITREIANKRSLHLHPLLAAFDELQNLFGHPKFGKQAGEDATFVIKLGRALAVFLILATQRPDKDSLPTGVSGVRLDAVLPQSRWPGRERHDPRHQRLQERGVGHDVSAEG